MKYLYFRTGDDIQPAHPTWYRGENCNFNPTKNALHDEAGLEEYLLKGWLPPRPFITRDMWITAFGSCFAQHISEWLMLQQYATGDRLVLINQGKVLHFLYDSHVIRFGEGMVNTFALRQQFEWALEDKQFSEDLWFGSRGELASYSESAREATALLFKESDVFIITLGLAEVWCNKQTGEVFWRAIPQDRFDPAVHGFRISTVEENRDNLEAIYSIVRKHRPSASIIFTLSPVPLVATFRPVSCITANSVSKAILRVAIDELMRAHDDDPLLFYWASYEIVKEYFTDPYLDDNRHPKPEITEFIMRVFADHYLVDPYPQEQMDAMVNRARNLFSELDGVSRELADLLIKHGILDCQALAQVPENLLARATGSRETAARIHRSALEYHTNAP